MLYCEICESFYDGIDVYSKHFEKSKHIDSLKKLGILNHKSVSFIYELEALNKFRETFDNI